MSEKSLLPCPFCKTELEIIGKGHYFAHKTNNGCILQHLCFEIDDEEAVKAWNTRKPMEAVVAELVELRKQGYCQRVDMERCSKSKSCINCYEETVREIVRGKE